jgi:hypothetical protein
MTLQANLKLPSAITTQVPYFVLPASFFESVGPNIIQLNAVGAILCNGQMLYGIFGDTKCVHF